MGTYGLSNTGECKRHRKVAYVSKQAARKARGRFHVGQHASVYKCQDGGYHVGHLPLMVRRGDSPRIAHVESPR